MRDTPRADILESENFCKMALLAESVSKKRIFGRITALSGKTIFKLLIFCSRVFSSSWNASCSVQLGGSDAAAADMFSTTRPRVVRRPRLFHLLPAKQPIAHNTRIAASQQWCLWMKKIFFLLLRELLEWLRLLFFPQREGNKDFWWNPKWMSRSCAGWRHFAKPQIKKNCIPFSGIRAAPHTEIASLFSQSAAYN